MPASHPGPRFPGRQPVLPEVHQHVPWTGQPYHPHRRGHPHISGVPAACYRCGSPPGLLALVHFLQCSTPVFCAWRWVLMYMTWSAVITSWLSPLRFGMLTWGWVCLHGDGCFLWTPRSDLFRWSSLQHSRPPRPNEGRGMGGGGWEESSIEREMLLPACGAAGPILEIEG